MSPVLCAGKLQEILPYTVSENVNLWLCSPINASLYNKQLTALLSYIIMMHALIMYSFDSYGYFFLADTDIVLTTGQYPDIILTTV